MPEQNIILFTRKEDCCGCQACVNACPIDAIQMEEDEYGFIYPMIDDQKCIQCGKCKKVCNYQKENMGTKGDQAFAAVWSDKNRLKNSASGGVFAALASEILRRGGVVFGCAMIMSDGKLTPKHIAINREEELQRLQGSKYVHSLTGKTYREVECLLVEGKEVLYSGTPCQIDGLYGYLQDKKYENLYTIDIVCHGVPSIEIFQNYISYMEENENINITDFSFRDKTLGWGIKAKIIYYNKRGRLKHKIIPNQLSSFYSFFLDCKLFRINCYSCKYATIKRVGDISIGDFWGIRNEHPEYLTDHGGEMEYMDGISCLLVNNEHGKDMLQKLGVELVYKPSSFGQIAKNNEQLNRPASLNKKRDELLNAYKESGYAGIEKLFNKQMGIKKYIYMIWTKLPKKMQKIIKRKF